MCRLVQSLLTSIHGANLMPSLMCREPTRPRAVGVFKTSARPNEVSISCRECFVDLKNFKTEEFSQT